MNMNEYFDKFDEIIENMGDEEFDQLLIRSGIENCELLEADDYRVELKTKIQTSFQTSSAYIWNKIYYTESNYNDFSKMLEAV